LFNLTARHFGVHDRVECGRQGWKDFADYMAHKSGKKVEIVEAPAGGAVIAEQLRSGKLHIAALSTGTVPLGVNRAGFVPCCILATDWLALPLSGPGDHPGPPAAQPARATWSTPAGSCAPCSTYTLADSDMNSPFSPAVRIVPWPRASLECLAAVTFSLSVG
jgi:hypothetical protein